MTKEQTAILRADMHRHQRLAMACEEACMREHHEAIAESLAAAVAELESPTRYVLISGGSLTTIPTIGTGGSGYPSEHDMSQYDLHAISVACTRAAERERMMNECRSVTKYDSHPQPSPERAFPFRKKAGKNRRPGK